MAFYDNVKEWLSEKIIYVVFEMKGEQYYENVDIFFNEDLAIAYAEQLKEKNYGLTCTDIRPVKMNELFNATDKIVMEIAIRSEVEKIMNRAKDTQEIIIAERVRNELESLNTEINQLIKVYKNKIR